MALPGRLLHSSLGKRGMVAAAHPLAVREGLRALEEGGNAMDACLVMAGVTTVVLPAMGGLGGDMFLLYYDRKDRTVKGLNSSGVPGNRVEADLYRKQGLHILPQDGIHSVTVPGTPLGLEAAAKKWGTFDLYKCLQPAIRIAREGFPVTPGFYLWTREQEEKLKKQAEAADIFLPKGTLPRVGENFTQPDLARTLAEYGEGGADYFYRGPFSAAFYRLNEALDGPFDGKELAQHEYQVYQPLQGEYRGFKIYQTAPVSQGFLHLEILNIIANTDLPAVGPSRAESIHLLAEAGKLAFADRNRYAGDPLVTGFDVQRLLSPAWARERFALIHPDKPGNISFTPLTPPEGDTTSFAAVDSTGNACSFIHSISIPFGSGLVVPGTGVLLNNRAGRSFNLVPGHPNCIARGKRPIHTLNCYLVFHQDDLFLAGGTPGGDGQPQWNTQILSLLIDHGASPQEAVDFPRWLLVPGTDMATLDQPFQIQIETRFPKETRRKLAAMGHSVMETGPWGCGGGAQIIMVDPDTGLLAGGSDRRVEGLALGF